jgi:hypothetical protein
MLKNFNPGISRLKCKRTSKADITSALMIKFVIQTLEIFKRDYYYIFFPSSGRARDDGNGWVYKSLIKLLAFCIKLFIVISETEINLFSNMI